MIKIWFVGEGRQDIGVPAEGFDQEQRCGCLVHFANNILAKEKYRNVHFTPDSGLLPRLNLTAKRRRGYEVKVNAAIVQAESEGIHGVVIVVDEPASKEGSRLSRLRAGRQAARDSGYTTPCALGVAIPELEAWLLADSKARASYLGAAGRRDLPTHPERLPDPRSCFATLYGEYRREREQKNLPVLEEWNVKESCAIDARVDVLVNICSKGFAPFANDVRIEIGNSLFLRRARRQVKKAVQ